MQTWTYPSSSGGAPHTTALQDDGQLACSCKGFLIKRKDKPRSCRHTEDVVKRFALNTVQRGDYLYSVGAGEVPAEDQRKDSIVNYEDRAADAEAAGYVNPMLATALTKGQEKNLDQFKDDYWWEEKWDGERKVVAVKGSAARFWSRPRPGEGTVGLDATAKIPKHIREHAASLPDGTYDSEIVNIGGRSWNVSDLTKKAQQVLILFDILKLQGANMMDKPIEVRRDVLEAAVKALSSPYILFSNTFEPGEAGVKAIWARGGEGAMLKRKGSIYRPGYRGEDWLKVKLWDYTTATLYGFEAAKSGPHSIMLFRFDDGVESKCKTLGNKWLAEFDKNGQKYIGKRFVVKHQGRTDDKKAPRHPQFDHFAGEGE